jgi:hypothetical protein
MAEIHDLAPNEQDDATGKVLYSFSKIRMTRGDERLL